MKYVKLFESWLNEGEEPNDFIINLYPSVRYEEHKEKFDELSKYILRDIIYTAAYINLVFSITQQGVSTEIPSGVYQELMRDPANDMKAKYVEAFVYGDKSNVWKDYGIDTPNIPVWEEYTKIDSTEGSKVLSLWKDSVKPLVLRYIISTMEKDGNIVYKKVSKRFIEKIKRDLSSNKDLKQILTGIQDEYPQIKGHWEYLTDLKKRESPKIKKDLLAEISDTDYSIPMGQIGLSYDIKDDEKYASYVDEQQKKSIASLDKVKEKMDPSLITKIDSIKPPPLNTKEFLQKIKPSIQNMAPKPTKQKQ
jgi:hypothetical protein